MQWCAPLTEAEKAEFVPFLKQLIEASFRNISSFFLMPITIEGKSNGTPVTEADKSTERMLREMIEALSMVPAPSFLTHFILEHSLRLKSAVMMANTILFFRP